MTTSQRASAVTLAVMDALIVTGAAISAAWIRFGSGELFVEEIGRLAGHPWFIAYVIVVQWGLALTFELYRPSAWPSTDYLLLRMTALALGLITSLALGVYLVMPWRFGRGLLVLTLLISLPLQTLARFLWQLIAALPQPRRAVVIGDGPIVGAFVEELQRRPSPPLQIVRHVPANGELLDRIHGQELLDGADLVVVAHLDDGRSLDRIAALNFRGTSVIDAAGAYAALTGRIPVLQVDSRWFIATGDFASLANSTFHPLQRLLDVVVASILLVVSAPVLLAAALVVLLSDGRPVLYRQSRLGRFGREFTLYKLRTMRRGSEANGPVFASTSDDRVLPAGRLMRRWRIDELPQLVNVLRGEMSLVGPRPERPEVARLLESEIPFYAFRYSVRPGLTGWAQVNLPYCAETEDHVKKLEFDLYSLRHYGPAMYAIVLLRTLGALVFRPGR